MSNENTVHEALEVMHEHVHIWNKISANSTKSKRLIGLSTWRTLQRVIFIAAAELWMQSDPNVGLGVIVERLMHWNRFMIEDWEMENTTLLDRNE